MLAGVRANQQGIAFSPPLPEAGEVRVMSLPLDVDRARLSWLSASLSSDEREKAERFRFDLHRDRFVAARGWLRTVLGSCLGVAPERVGFRYGRNGKPALEPELYRSGLRFNVSHSQGLGLCAIAKDRDVGIDLELVKPLADLERVAYHFFSPREVAALRDLRGDQKLLGFYACWTRKEAFIKATGEGLSRPLHEFAVTVRAGAEPRLEWVADDPTEVGRWSLAELRPAPGYLAALAVEGPLRALSFGTNQGSERGAFLAPLSRVDGGFRMEAR
jgi:4'-phosphopantetheinyl transferase